MSKQAFDKIAEGLRDVRGGRFISKKHKLQRIAERLAQNRAEGQGVVDAPKDKMAVDG